MPSPEKERKKMEVPSPAPQANPIPSLPYDLVLSCIARVSRLYYPTLSFVSKSFRTLLASPELYKARSLLGRTESCLYVCIQPYPIEDPTWYTLCLKPNQTLTKHSSKKKQKKNKKNKKKKKKSSGRRSIAFEIKRFVLAQLEPKSFRSKDTVPRSHHPTRAALVSVGSDIYSIGSGYFHPSSSVSVLDCRSHTWHEAPSMDVELKYVSASVLGRNIYVEGTHVDESFKEKWFQVLDTETQIWKPLPIICSKTKDSLLRSRSACFNGKFYVYTNEGSVGYDPKESRWEDDDVVTGPETDRDRFMQSDSSCEIENVLYCLSYGMLIWSDSNSEVEEWGYMKGLKGLSMFPPGANVRLADYGGNMAVLWEEELPREKMIWCAEIALERRDDFEIWGKVEWFDHMLTVPLGYNLLRVLVPTV